MRARPSSLIVALLFAGALGLDPGRAAASGIFGSWNPVGPGAGNLTSLTVHPGSPGWVWLGMPHGGLYRSADRGVSWTWAGRPFADRGGITAIAADTSRPAALWVANKSGFWSSLDGGTHWTQVAGKRFTSRFAPGTSPRSVLSLPGALYVTTSSRLLESTDGGHNWGIRFDVASLGGGWIQSLAASQTAPRRLFLAVFGPERPALLRSVDGGTTWSELTSAPVADIGFESILATAQGVYVTRIGADPGLFLSTDAGLTWREIRDPASGASHDVRSLAVDPVAPRTLYMTSSIRDREFPEVALRSSHDAGRTWRRIAPAPGGSLLLDGLGTLYARSDSLLKRSADGGRSWATAMIAPQSESSFARLERDAARPASLLLTVGWASYRSGNQGASWRLVNAPLGVRDMIAEPDDPNRLIAITSSAAFKSDDGGRAWRRTGDGLWYLESMVRIDDRTILAAGAGIARTGDDGESWQIALPGWAPGSDVGRWTQKIATDATDPSSIYALSFQIRNLEPPHDVLAGAPSVLWKSTDNGRSWRKTAANLRTFAVDPHLSRVYGVRNRDFLQSDDGRTWSRIGLTPGLVHELVPDPLAPDTFYAVGAGVWRTRDRGATWQLLTSDWSPATLQVQPPAPGDLTRVLFGADRLGVLRTTIAAP